MIKVCESSITITREDGSSSFFDPDELLARLDRACRTAGLRETWIAEDIVLAIEYALSCRARDAAPLSAAEIDATVLKTLEDLGHPEIAKMFLAARPDGLLIPTISSNASQLLARHLGLSGPQLEKVCARVVKACSALGIKEAAPALIVELARHFKSEELPAPLLALSSGLERMPEGSSHWLVSAEDLLAGSSAELRRLTAAGILTPHGVSRLFPAIKIDLDLTAFARLLKLEAPATEMALMPHFHLVATALNSLFLLLKERASSPDGALPPFFLCVPEVSRFAREYLDADWPAAEFCCRELISSLVEQLSVQPFKLSLK